MNSQVLHDHFIAAIRGARENGISEAQIARQFRDALDEAMDEGVPRATGYLVPETVLNIDCIDAGLLATPRHAE